MHRLDQPDAPTLLPSLQKLLPSAMIYSDEPWQLVKVFEEMGAKWVHLVDLNGAFAGEPKKLRADQKDKRKHKPKT